MFVTYTVLVRPLTDLAVTPRTVALSERKAGAAPVPSSWQRHLTQWGVPLRQFCRYSRRQRAPTASPPRVQQWRKGWTFLDSTAFLFQKDQRRAARDPLRAGRLCVPACDRPPPYVSQSKAGDLPVSGWIGLSLDSGLGPWCLPRRGGASAGGWPPRPPPSHSPLWWGGWAGMGPLPPAHQAGTRPAPRASKGAGALTRAAADGGAVCPHLADL